MPTSLYRLNSEQNNLEPVEQATFQQLNFTERYDLQEWIAHNPSVLGEELLIIQKEFSGFADTRERLDLLALDREGNLVIIENKLDDSGRDVTWQALKYASYCSSLTYDQIVEILGSYLSQQQDSRSANEMLEAFFEGQDFEEMTLNAGATQRIFLVAAEFRKEVTSTVLWLQNFGVQIKCFRVTPHRLNDQILLNFDQIIPVPETEGFMIGMNSTGPGSNPALRNRPERQQRRHRFWSDLLERMQGRTDLFNTISPSMHNWIGRGSGIAGLGFNFVISQRFGRAEIYIDVDRDTGERNEAILEWFRNHQEQLSESLRNELEWESLPGRRACRIKSQFDASITEEDTWPQICDEMIDRMIRIEAEFRPLLEEMRRDLEL